MVLQNRLNFGFINGYQAPPIPRAPRSARRRAHTCKKNEENQMCAFDLLATVAGKILLEGQSAASYLPNGECQDEDVVDCLNEEKIDASKPPNLDLSDQETPETGLIEHDIKLTRAEGQVSAYIADFAIGTCSGSTSDITSSDFSDKIICDGKVVLSSDINVSVSESRKLECLPNLENHAVEQVKYQQVDSVGEAILSTGSDGCSLEDPEFFNQKCSLLTVNSDNSIKPNIVKRHYPCSSVFPYGDNNVKIVTRDDDEIFSQCTQRSAFMKTSRFPACFGDRRRRKLLASRYWRVAPKVKDEDISDNGGNFHSTYLNKNRGYKRQRSQRIYPLKKRKIFDYNSPLKSDSTVDCDAICNSAEEASTSMTTSGFANSILSSANDSQVRLKIKSFRVPELFIEMPETATVASLKRAVVEAINALLGGGLRVGVLVQGRKIRDDSKTLLQTGISQDKQIDALGFTLEPNPSQVDSATCSDNLPLKKVAQLVSSSINKSAQATDIAAEGNVHPSLQYPSNNVSSSLESDHDSASFPAEISTEKGGGNSSRALVTIPEANPAALAVVPPQPKSKRSEMAQRRIRRPFSVSEVEALVQAVEKLGTGRWRDVKLRAFDNVNHRTYVDLKDKWKTLVHTARISPQQRRGEPVPQVLLDRVLGAHAYWSQQQAKQHHKHQGESCLLL